MAVLRQTLFISGLIFCTNSMALNFAGIEQPVNESLYDKRSCNELYMQASALEHQSYIYKTDLYSDKGSQVAAYALTVFSPAVYYFGFKAYKNYTDQVRSQAALSEIDQIRYRMAEKRCFEQN